MTEDEWKRRARAAEESYFEKLNREALAKRDRSKTEEQLPHEQDEHDKQQREQRSGQNGSRKTEKA